MRRFVGNVLLKASQGAAKLCGELLREGIQSRIRHQLGALLLKPVFRLLRERTNYSEYGGAPLLGVNGICIIGHGKSDGHAVTNALRVAREAVVRKLNSNIQAVYEAKGKG